MGLSIGNMNAKLTLDATGYEGAARSVAGSHDRLGQSLNTLISRMERQFEAASVGTRQAEIFSAAQHSNSRGAIEYALSLDRQLASLERAEAAKAQAEAADRRRQSAVGSIVAALEQEAATLGMTSDQIEVYQLQQNNASQKTIRHAQALQGTIAAYREEALAARESAAAEQQRASSIDRVVAGVMEEAATLGMTNAELVAYRLSQLGASEATIQSAASKARDVQESKEAAASEQQRIATVSGLISALQTENETLGMTSQELQIYTLRQAGATEADIRHAQAIQLEISEYNSLRASVTATTQAENLRTSSIDRIVAEMQEEYATLGMTAGQLNVYKLAQLNASDATLQSARMLARKTDAARQAMEEERRLANEQSKTTAAGQQLSSGFNRQTMAAQQLAFAVEDAASVYGTMGLAGAFRAAGNNISQATMLFAPHLGVLASLGVAAASVAVNYATADHATEKHANSVQRLTDEYTGLDAAIRRAQEASSFNASMAEIPDMSADASKRGYMRADSELEKLQSESQLRKNDAARRFEEQAEPRMAGLKNFIATAETDPFASGEKLEASRRELEHLEKLSKRIREDVMSIRPSDLKGLVSDDVIENIRKQQFELEKVREEQARQQKLSEGMKSRHEEASEEEFNKAAQKDEEDQEREKEQRLKSLASQFLNMADDAAKYKKALQELEEVYAGGALTEEQYSTAWNHIDQMYHKQSAEAKKAIEFAKTPGEKFQERISELYQMRDNGEISESVFDANAKDAYGDQLKAMQKKGGPVGADAIDWGSKEAYQSVAKAVLGAQENDAAKKTAVSVEKAVEEAKKQTTLLSQINNKTTVTIAAAEIP